MNAESLTKEPTPADLDARRARSAYRVAIVMAIPLFAAVLLLAVTSGITGCVMAVLWALVSIFAVRTARSLHRLGYRNYALAGSTSFAGGAALMAAVSAARPAPGITAVCEGLAMACFAFAIVSNIVWSRSKKGSSTSPAGDKNKS